MGDIYLDFLQETVEIDLISASLASELILEFGEYPVTVTAGQADSAFSIKEIDYSVLAADLGVGKTIGMTHPTEDRTFTLPAIISGMIAPITLAKLGAGKLIIDGDASDYVGFGVEGGSIYNDTDQVYVSVTLQPVFSIKRWILLNMVGSWRRS